MEDIEIRRATYPRVSEIIAKQNEAELRAIPLSILADACIRGTKVHEYCTTYMKNLWVMDIEPQYLPYFDAFRLWAKENVTRTLHSPVRLYDDQRRFSGEFDMIVELKTGEIALIDIKTSAAKSKSWAVQLAAYHHLCKLNGYPVDIMFNVHLKRKEAGEFEVNDQGEKVLVSPPVIKTSIVKCEDINASWEIFSSALRCYDYFDRKEKKNVCI